MNRGCAICLGEPPVTGLYHSRCLETLFDAKQSPALEADLKGLHALALSMIGHTSISGVQKKVSLSLSSDRATLRVVFGPSHYILKPQTESFPHLPENEHATMMLARLFGIEVPPCGLVELRDGTLAYIIRRFDRTLSGGKFRQEDFCQLAEFSPKEKYHGSAELCVKIVNRHAAEPLAELLKLYRLLVFVWWSGNGDMHLKNFSLLIESDNRPGLSPAYDLVCTDLYPGLDPSLALPLCGKKGKLTRATWLRFARYAGIPEKAAGRVLETIPDLLPDARDLLDRSWLPDDLKQRYAEGLDQRARLVQSR